MVKLFSKNSDLCDHNSPTSQTDGRTDGQTTCDRNTALCTKVHRAVKTIIIIWFKFFRSFNYGTSARWCPDFRGMYCMHFKVIIELVLNSLIRLTSV